MKLRRALAVVLALLLLSLQSQALVHPLSHLGLGKPKETVLASSTLDAACLECALLAGGSTAVLPHVAILQHGDAFNAVLVRHRSQRATDAPPWFRSRAPPAFLV